MESEDPRRDFPSKGEHPILRDICPVEPQAAPLVDEETDWVASRRRRPVKRVLTPLYR